MLFFLPGGDDTERKAFIFPLLVTSFLREKCLLYIFKSSIVLDFGKKESNGPITNKCYICAKILDAFLGVEESKSSITK